ncbi:hypothetical protein BH09SUM1_BH09SUM1_20060 [soil metagenome]
MAITRFDHLDGLRERKINVKLRTSFHTILFIGSFSGISSATTIYVSPTGSASGTGTAADPVQTIPQAIALNGDDIVMESGEYINASALTIPRGTTVHGGYLRNGAVWKRDYRPTYLLNTVLPGQASIILASPIVAGNPGASLQDVTIVSGFVSLQLNYGSSAVNVEFSGGSYAAALIQDSLAGFAPATIYRSRVSGGQTGILVQSTGGALIKDTMVRNTQGAGMLVSGSGSVTVKHCVFQNSTLDGATISDNSNVVIENSIFRRNAQDGLRVLRCSPNIQGSFFELNNNGVTFSLSETGMLKNCTTVNNRQSGIFMSESRASVVLCISALNKSYGLREDQTEVVPPDPPPAKVTGLLQNNIFFGNTTANYLDEEATPYQTANEINTMTQNDQQASLNQVVDPKFVSSTTGNYRIKPGSPAVDAALETSAFTEDLDANLRRVNISVVGFNDPNAIDVGAWELQDHYIYNFGTEYYDSSFVTDPALPGVLLEVKRNPVWEHNPLTAFNHTLGDLLPGRISINAQETSSFGFLYRDNDDLFQPANTIVKVRARLSAPANEGLSVARMRINWPGVFHVAQLFDIESVRGYHPTTTPRTYEMYFDLQQADYRGVSSATMPSYPTMFNLDLIEAQPEGPHVPLVLDQYEVSFQQRATFEPQISQLVASWDFASDIQGWTPELNQFFAQPTLRYSSAKTALELVQIQDGTFGSYSSPSFTILPGRIYMAEFRVSSDRPTETATSFRARISGVDFAWTNELVILSGNGGLAALQPAGRTYRMYGRVPGDYITQDARFFFDIFGFEGPQRGGSLFLEDVKIYTIPG